MNVNIQTVHFKADNKLVDYVNKKLSRLDTFHDRIVKVDVYLQTRQCGSHYQRQDCRNQSTCSQAGLFRKMFFQIIRRIIRQSHGITDQS